MGKSRMVHRRSQVGIVEVRAARREAELSVETAARLTGRGEPCQLAILGEEAVQELGAGGTRQPAASIGGAGPDTEELNDRAAAGKAGTAHRDAASEHR